MIHQFDTQEEAETETQENHRHEPPYQNLRPHRQNKSIFTFQTQPLRASMMNPGENKSRRKTDPDDLCWLSCVLNNHRQPLGRSVHHFCYCSYQAGELQRSALLNTVICLPTTSNQICWMLRELIFECGFSENSNDHDEFGKINPKRRISLKSVVFPRLTSTTAISPQKNENLRTYT